MLLLITDRYEFGRTLAARLRESGIFLIQSPTETAEFSCERYDIGGVILDCIPDLQRGERLCAALRAEYPPMPIAAIVHPDTFPDLAVERLLRGEDESVLAAEALDFCVRDCGWRLSTLSTYQLSVGLTPKETVYVGYPLLLSPREHTILRCLFYRSPRLTSADELMTLCYADEGQSISNIAVHIRNINRRAAQFDPRPLIVNVYSKGYRLRDDILER